VANAADVIARCLYEAGCRYAFGIPGGEVLSLIDALERADIEFVLTKHENAAGFMAEGVYQRTGAPGRSGPVPRTPPPRWPPPGKSGCR
jgi:acetolactate synthase-1/2/3 large subunit